MIDYSKPEYKTMFANYGLTMLSAQGLEKMLLVLIAAVYTLNKKFDSVQSLYLTIYGYNEETLGQLIRKVEKIIEIPETIVADLSKAQKERNYLAHHFFLDLSALEHRMEFPDQLNFQMKSMKALFDRLSSEINNVIGLLLKHLDPVSYDTERERLMTVLKPIAKEEKKPRR